MKYKLQLVLALLAFLIPMVIVAYDSFTEKPIEDYPPPGADGNIVISDQLYPVWDWQLGDDIIPCPFPARDRPALDCDDVSIYSYLFMRFMNYDVEFAYGNLEKTGESNSQSNHYWVVATDNTGKRYPYDWGYYCQDEQHFEYRIKSYRYVLENSVIKDPL